MYAHNPESLKTITQNLSSTINFYGSQSPPTTIITTMDNNDRSYLPLVKRSLVEEFSTTTATNGDSGNLDSLLDDPLLLTYITTLLTDWINDTSEESLSELTSDITTLLSPYIPPTDDSKMTSWITRVTNDIKQSTASKNTLEEDPAEKFSRVLSMVVEEQQQTLKKQQQPSSRTTSVSEDALPEPKSSKTLEALMEMFPNRTKDELTRVLADSDGDLQGAVGVLLEGASGVIIKRKKQRSHNSSTTTDDDYDEEDFFDEEENLLDRPVAETEVFKDKLVERYGYISTVEDTRSHRPTLPKQEPKKLLRYRDSQIVSTKGERYTEVAVTHTGEEVKIRSYLSKSQRAALAEDPRALMKNN